MRWGAEFGRPQAVIEWAARAFPRFVASTSFGPNAPALLYYMEDFALRTGTRVSVAHIEMPETSSEAAEYARAVRRRFSRLDFISVPRLRRGKAATMSRFVSERGIGAVLYGAHADQSDWRRENLRIAMTMSDCVARIYPLLHMTLEQARTLITEMDLPIHPAGLPGVKGTAECGLHEHGRV